MAATNPASVPKTMKAVIIDKNGGPEVLQHRTDIPVPVPIDGQVLVKNEYIGINYIDVYYRTGLYAAPQFPYILGREAAGTVVALGGGETYGLAVGDRVAYLGEGAYAQYTAAPAKQTVKMPASMPAQTAAATLLQGLTALTLVREAHPVRAGDAVLVQAAAGGTGLWLCRLLRALGARPVVATAGSDAKLERARRAGADVLVNYAEEDVVARVNEATDGKGCAAVFDGVGAATFEASLASVARKGTLVTFGNASGPVPPLAPARLSARNVRLLRPTLFQYVVTRDEWTGYVGELMAFVAGEREPGPGEPVPEPMDVDIHATYPLSEVARAHQDLEGRKTTGKLLLDPEK
ncbi:NAD(P)-binding protein [Xylariaceae sp. FL0804]|nr:NAD(P)-binding protein [Xylariaceae sp. FL0804]